LFLKKLLYYTEYVEFEYSAYFSARICID
jgi:hypothetical protein